MKAETYAINGLPVLPDGFWWNLHESHRQHGPLTLSIHRGSASRNGYSGYSAPIAETEIPEKWHWLVRAKGRRLFKRAFRDGEPVVPKVKPRFDERYQPTTVYNSLHAE